MGRFDLVRSDQAPGGEWLTGGDPSLRSEASAIRTEFGMAAAKNPGQGTLTFDIGGKPRGRAAFVPFRRASLRHIRAMVSIIA